MLGMWVGRVAFINGVVVAFINGEIIEGLVEKGSLKKIEGVSHMQIRDQRSR